jgi:hypothetical protein
MGIGNETNGKRTHVTVEAGGSLVTDKLRPDSEGFHQGGQPVSAGLQVARTVGDTPVIWGLNYSIAAPHVNPEGNYTYERPPLSTVTGTLGAVVFSVPTDPNHVGIGAKMYVGGGIGQSLAMETKAVADAKAAALNLYDNAVEGLQQQATAAATAAQAGQVTEIPASLLSGLSADQLKAAQALLGSVTTSASIEVPSAAVLAEQAGLPDRGTLEKTLNNALNVPKKLHPWAEAKAQVHANIPVAGLEMRPYAQAAGELGTETRAYSTGVGLNIGQGIDNLPLPLPRANMEGATLYGPPPVGAQSGGSWSAGVEVNQYHVDKNRFVPDSLNRPSVREIVARATVGISDQVTLTASYSQGDNPSSGLALPVAENYRGPDNVKTGKLGLSMRF